jgi:tRNA(Ile)-lysidine synthase
MLRGGESERDEEFVRSLCEDLSVPFYSGRGDVAAFARENSLGTEEAARKLRYDFLFKTASDIDAAKIATAHTADDNAETVIMRIARGTGLKGLCGIPPVRDNIIRPILPLTRREVEDYLEKYGLPHVEDSTNFSDDYTRNKIRHLVMPVLREINPKMAEAASSMTELLAQDEKFLEQETEAALKRFTGGKLSVKELLDLPEPVLRRVIMAKAGENLNKVHVESILSLLRTDDPSAELSIPGMKLRREYDSVIFGSEQKPEGFQPVTAAPGGTVHIHELGLYIECTEEKVGKINNSFNNFFFKSDSICGKIVIRPRKAGDAMNTPGGRKTLKKLFIEKKIPALTRCLTPVIADDEKVLAVFGIGQDRSLAPEPGEAGVKITIKKREQSENEK